MKPIHFLFFLLFSLSPLIYCQPFQETFPDARLSEIQNLAMDDHRHFKVWWTGWLAGYSVATIVQTGIGLASHDNSLRQDMFLGAGTTLLGAAGQLVTPMVKADPEIFVNLEGLNEQDKMKLIAEIQIYLEKSARREALGRSFAAHATSGIVNIASGMISWKGFHRTPMDGFLNFLMNTAITEAQIWSQPMIARHYMQTPSHIGSSTSMGHSDSGKIIWTASLTGNGFNFRILF